MSITPSPVKAGSARVKSMTGEYVELPGNVSRKIAAILSGKRKAIDAGTRSLPTGFISYDGIEYIWHGANLYLKDGSTLTGVVEVRLLTAAQMAVESGNEKSSRELARSLTSAMSK